MEGKSHYNGQGYTREKIEKKHTVFKNNTWLIFVRHWNHDQCDQTVWQ